ncbi:MAG: D-glycero-beta-D-manno-heptose-7-phosphate kinase [Candidatus Auribacterota bacterium]|jgi:D-beta-D-heptose 7-phosphate kinase/D-beta-D-heptose 1-phosphate adenosyltransferase|nr:D-glycero-beta-D-manno-heptose-7-phosphate kinase [Candidatus Auribacterota bacterium]
MERLTVDRAQEIIKRFENKNILVIGDVILDEYIWGSVHRISPEAPVPVVEATRRSFMTGGASNVARNLRDLGVNVSLVGCIGNDDIGRHLQSLLHGKQINVDGLLVLDDRPTTLKTRIIGQHQQIVRIDWEDCKSLSQQQVKRIVQYVSDIKHKLDAIVFEDYGKGVISDELVRAILDETAGSTMITSFDPKRGHFISLNGMNIATPNHAEAFDALSIPERLDPESLKNAGFALLDKWGVKSVLITLGEHGMALFERPDVMHRISTVAREVFDVSGAGDTVIASLTAALAAEATNLEAAVFSNFAAGVVVGKVGTASVTPSEILNAVKSYHIDRQSKKI